MFSRIEQKTGTIISNGRMDQYLYPFFKKDMDEERLTEDEATDHEADAMDCDRGDDDGDDVESRGSRRVFLANGPSGVLGAWVTST
jgi:hypothetical protein